MVVDANNDFFNKISPTLDDGIPNSRNLRYPNIYPSTRIPLSLL